MSSDEITSNQLAGAEIANLYGAIDKDNVHGLNLSVPEDAKAIIKPWDEREDTGKYAESGVDDQIIVHIPFTQNVRLKSILLKLGRGESTPRRLRIYTNHATIVDFSDAENTNPRLDISLLEDETSVTEYPLRVAAFSNVHSVSLFFSEAVGGETSLIYFVGFRGTVTTPKKDPNTTLEIPAANAADAPVDRVTEKAAGQQTTAR